MAPSERKDLQMQPENYAGPNSVLETAEAAEELHARMFAPQEPVEEEEVVEEVVPEVVPDPEDDVPEDKEYKELRKFKDRYLTLKGKYDAEVPRLASELKELRTKMEEGLKTQQIQKPAEPEESDPYVALKEMYGDDLAELMRKLVLKETRQQNQPVLESTEQRLATVEELQIKTAQDAFMSEIDSKVQGWRDAYFGNDPKFAEFLQQPDPSGLYTYQELVEAYSAKWDADKLAKVFKTYQEQNTVVQKPPKQNEPTPQQSTMIAPNRSNSQPTPNTANKRIWSQNDIAEFQKRDRIGNADPAEWEDLLLALSENRIRN